MATQTVTAHIPKELVARIDAMAVFEDRPRGWVVKQALADWVDMAEERHRMLQEAFDDVEAGRLIAHEDMIAWAESIGTEKPLPLPEV